jgi:hypothetical protein
LSVISDQLTVLEDRWAKPHIISGRDIGIMVLISAGRKLKKQERSRLQSIPLAFRAEQALKEAVAEAIAAHTRAGVAIVAWRYGKVFKVPVDQLEIREQAAEYKDLNEKGK